MVYLSPAAQCTRYVATKLIGSNSGARTDTIARVPNSTKTNQANKARTREQSRSHHPDGVGTALKPGAECNYKKKREGGRSSAA